MVLPHWQLASKIIPSSLCSAENFLQFTFHRSALKLKLSRGKSNLFLTITFRFMAYIVQFNTEQSLFKSHHDELLIGDQWPRLLFAFLLKFSALVIYLVKYCDLVRPQLSHIPLIILTAFLVEGFTFSITFWLTDST